MTLGSSKTYTYECRGHRMHQGFESKNVRDIKSPNNISLLVHHDIECREVLGLHVLQN
jgi:hypothetical protein